MAIDKKSTPDPRLCQAGPGPGGAHQYQGHMTEMDYHSAPQSPIEGPRVGIREASCCHPCMTRGLATT